MRATGMRESNRQLTPIPTIASVNSHACLSGSGNYRMLLQSTPSPAQPGAPTGQDGREWGAPGQDAENGITHMAFGADTLRAALSWNATGLSRSVCFDGHRVDCKYTVCLVYCWKLAGPDWSDLQLQSLEEPTAARARQPVRGVRQALVARRMARLRQSRGQQQVPGLPQLGQLG